MGVEADRKCKAGCKLGATVDSEKECDVASTFIRFRAVIWPGSELTGVRGESVTYCTQTGSIKAIGLQFPPFLIWTNEFLLMAVQYQDVYPVSFIMCL